MRLIKLLVVIAVFLSVSVVAFAHPGKTDSNGGHIDHSTGEYHYHHGYSAHQHTDQDGDGNLDCPYNFDDQTKSLASGEATSKANTVKIVPEKETEIVSKEKPKKIKITEGSIMTFCMACIGFGIIVDAIKYAIDEIRRRFKN